MTDVVPDVAAGGVVESAEAVMAAHIRQKRRLVEASPELFDRG